MNRIQQDSRRVVRTGTQYPATIIDVHGDRASAQLSGNGAKLHNLAVIGGPVEIGEAVSVDFTTPDPTIVATAKDWLSIEDILRALGKLPEPLMTDSFAEFDKVVCFCIDDPTQFFLLGADSWNGYWDAIDIIESDGSTYGYMRRWGIRLPPTEHMGTSQSTSGGTHIPLYMWGVSKEQTILDVHSFYTCYGTYFENITFDFYNPDFNPGLIPEGIQLDAWANTSVLDEFARIGNPIYSPSNNYLLLPSQLFNGYIFRNCDFRNSWIGMLEDGDTDQGHNISCITVNPVSHLEGYRDGDDIAIFENCKFFSRNSYEPHLVQNMDDWAFPSSDGYRTHIYLYDCEVDCLDKPMSDDLDYVDVSSIGTRWLGVPNILGLNNHDILKTSDRAALDHIHGSSGSSGGYDENALHDNELGEIYMVTEKTDPVGADLLLIEDSEASYAKKKVQIANLPFTGGSSGSGGGASTFLDLTDTPSAYTGQGGKLVSVKNTVDGLEFVNAPTAGSDGNAIHDNVADEIHQVTEKVTPADNDEILIEDSAASWAKKRLKISNLPSSGSGGGDMYKSTYDTNDDGKVNSADSADAVPWSGVSSKPDPLDATAIHDNVAAEISAVTEKASPVSADLILIEDSEASNAKKRVQVGNLPTGSSGSPGADIGARVYHNATQTITGGVNEMLAFNSEQYDTDNIHDVSTNNSRLTCQTAGRYLISATVFMASNSGGNYRELAFRVNGTDYIAAQRTHDLAGVATPAIELTTVYDLDVGDYVECSAKWDGSGELDVVHNEHYTPYFMMQLLSASGGAASASDIGARVYLASDQTNIATSTTTAIDFDTEDYDTDNLWTSGSGSRFTINTAGKYHIWGSVEWESNTDNARTVYIRKNGSVDIAWERDGGSSTGDVKKMGVSTIIDLEIGDYVELAVRHTAGVALDIQASGITTAFAIQKISSGGGDADAIHDNVSAEISAITEKTTPHDNDLILIEDSEASNAKKRVQIGNLPSSGSGSGSSTFLGLTDTPSSFVGQGGKFAKVNDAESALEFVVPDAGTSGSAFIGTVLESGTVGASGLSAITLDNIPAGYNYLEIRIHGRSTYTGGDTDAVSVEFNDDSTAANYWRQRFTAGFGTNHSSGQGGDNWLAMLATEQATNTYSIGTWVGIIDGYDNENFHKNIRTKSNARYQNTTSGYIEWYENWWENTNAITKISLALSNGNFAEGTQYTIIGYKNQAVPSGLVSDIGASVYNSSDITISNATVTPLSFDTEIYDTANLFTTSGSGFTINVAGKYLVHGQAWWEQEAGTPTGQRVLYIYKNDTNVGQVAVNRPGDNESPQYQISRVLDLDVGDIVSFRVYQNSGGDLDIRYLSDRTPIFTIQKISSGGGDADAIHDNVAGEISALTEKTVPVGADLVLIEDSEASNAKKKVQISKFADVGVVNGRLTLESGVPVSTSDQSAKTTLYFAPYMGNNIGLFTSGSVGYVRDFSELSLSLTGLTASTPYDIWIYDNAGTLTLDKTAWTDDTTRATAIVSHSGIYVKSGDVTRRYLGTIYINSTGGQTEDTNSERYVWNYYNRVKKLLYLYEDTQHTYTTATIRIWNNSTVAGETIHYAIIGVAEDAIKATGRFHVQSINNASQVGSMYCRLNTDYGVSTYFGGAAGWQRNSLPVDHSKMPIEGLNYVAAYESGNNPSITYYNVIIYTNILG